MQIDSIYKLILISWQNGLISGKCCLILGSVSASTQNEDAQYTMGGSTLNITLKEKDLGLTISADMKVSE